jgi:hypothetical protein
MISQPYTLVGVDIEGEWNRPLLSNAAAISGCPCVFTHSVGSTSTKALDDPLRGDAMDNVLRGFQRVLACETGKSSVSIYELPAPRERTAVLVGNEQKGLPRAALKRADRIVAVPMACSGLSSLNVAVSAAICLYALTRDFGRKQRARSGLRIQDVDVLIQASADPHELGSLLRSIYAFGWRRVFLSDPNKIWFTDNPRIILESRAAARRDRNLLAVLPAERLEPTDYDAMLICDSGPQGQALSRLRLPECVRLLVVFGGGESQATLEIPAAQVSVDFADRTVRARERHAGSTLLSVIAIMLDA